MIPTGIRIFCPQCTLDDVVTEEVGRDETKLPEKIHRREHNTFFCPNCSIPMETGGTVDTTPKPPPAFTGPLTMDKLTARVAALIPTIDSMEAVYEELAEDAKDAKKRLDKKRDELVAINRLIAKVQNGEVVNDPDYKPLLDPKNQVTEPADDLVTGIDQQHEDLMHRLEACDYIVGMDTVRGWSTETYDGVIAYVAALEDHRNGKDVVLPPRPDVLPAPIEAAMAPRKRGKLRAVPAPENAAPVPSSAGEQSTETGS